MILPEPARTLWKEHRDAIARIANAPGKPSRIMLGGGSVLAARWKHRDSTDIDILMPDRKNLADAGRGRPRDLARATGGRHKNTTHERVSVEVENGRLDITATEPQLPGLETCTDVHGCVVEVLHNAQILRGKCYRTERAVTRDAFDMAVAAEMDPQALEMAVNSLDEARIRVICHNLLTTNDTMTGEAETELKGVPQRYEKHLQRVGDAAADATWNHRYTRVQIRITDAGIVIETTNRTRSTRKTTHREGGAHRALTQAGIGAYIEANTAVELETLEETIDALRDKGSRGVIFDSEDGAGGAPE